MIKKILGILFLIFLLLLIALGVFVGMNYHSDHDLSMLKDKYSIASSKFINIKGMPVHYSVDGTGEKTLLLIHGTASSLHTWDPWVEKMKDQFRIIRLDLPGFGLTGPNPQKRYDRIFYLIFLETFIDKLGLEKIHIAGNSFGGYLAWNYTLNHPFKVDKLILLNSSGYPRNDETIPLGFKLAKDETVGPWIEKITPRFLIHKTVKDSYENDELISDELVDRYFDLLLREGNREALMLKMQHIKLDNWRKIKKIKNPTLIMWGDQDRVVPPEHAYRFHKDIKGSEFIMYEKIGHLPMEENAQNSANDALEFLNSNFASRQ